MTVRVKMAYNSLQKIKASPSHFVRSESLIDPIDITTFSVSTKDSENSYISKQEPIFNLETKERIVTTLVSPILTKSNFITDVRTC